MSCGCSAGWQRLRKIATLSLVDWRLHLSGQWLEEGAKAKLYPVKPDVREVKVWLGRELSIEEGITEAGLDYQ